MSGPMNMNLSDITSTTTTTKRATLSIKDRAIKKRQAAFNKKQRGIKKKERAIKKKEVSVKKKQREIKKKELTIAKKQREIVKMESAINKKKTKEPVTNEPKAKESKAIEPVVKEPEPEESEAEQSEGEQSKAEQSQAEESEEEESDTDPMEEAFAEFNEKNVDIFSEEVIRTKLLDIPTCCCGGHCVCLECKNKHNITLTQKHCSGSRAAAPGEEFLCKMQYEMKSNGEEDCFSDAVGTLPCFLCMKYGPGMENGNPKKWSQDMDPSFLIGESGVCPGCCIAEPTQPKCNVCFYPVEFMQD